ncbi:Short-chain dehydrogenase/reductase family protein [Mycena sanguinolenta]|uniref:Short-chain dehydrogenase/reductase family protein n=1 Tax=Mycena sanguinolenta TaxID=230812 RepID=A0A8H7DI17_9AGAR|nr:Short-chain dehydrogenase/reductase family protein [Mycena sanguinolenta]
MVRTILVTGANQGLGMHTVHQLGEMPDTVVFMGSRKLTAAEEALSKFTADVHHSSTVVPIQLDVTDNASIQAAQVFVADFLKTKGIQSLDVIINNAAIFVESLPDSFATNVIGAASIAEAFRPSAPQQHRGCNPQHLERAWLPVALLPTPIPAPPGVWLVQSGA